MAAATATPLDDAVSLADFHKRLEAETRTEWPGMRTVGGNAFRELGNTILILPWADPFPLLHQITVTGVVTEFTTLKQSSFIKISDGTHTVSSNAPPFPDIDERLLLISALVHSSSGRWLASSESTTFRFGARDLFLTFCPRPAHQSSGPGDDPRW